MSISAAPLIDPEDRQRDEQLTIRVRPEVARDLRAYGQYAANSSSSHVVSAALRRLFKEDKGFRGFKEANPSAGEVSANGKRRTRSKRSEAA